ncbi:hypothetical protein GH714_040936 [Hevea brasiliensis]|uniref:Uncharacterized protein n=1 Tax=Hevea brasiliensis TaxID=3981 RepID=A0A6A6MKH9_HEVBR|nr:hypothetical protein GH714_040936 [Hevea brasiliensis]
MLTLIINCSISLFRKVTSDGITLITGNDGILSGNGRLCHQQISRHCISVFICQDILPTGALHSEKYGTNDWCKHIKVEDGSDFSPLASIPVTSGYLHSKTLFPSDNLDKDPSLGYEDLTAFDTVSTIQGLSGITSSSCALSLLSSQSHNYLSHSSGISMACPLLVPGSNTHYGVNQVSEKLTGDSSQASASVVPNKFSSSGASSAEGSQLGSILISDGSDAINFDLTDGIYQGSNFMNAEDHLSCEDGTTIDLLQLSSQLQQVEHQKQSMQAKQENDAFCWPHIT